MRRITIILLICTLVLGMMPGCANIQDDGTRTRTEGALVGTGVGAAAGAAIGGAVGGRGGALVGLGIGAGVGLIAGLFVGAHIAEQKSKYASEEAWLDACLNQAEESNNKLRQYNADLQKQIVVMDKDIKNMQAAYDAKTVDKNALVAERKKIEKQIAQNEEVIKGIDAEVAGQAKVLADARANKKGEEAALLDAEIASLQRQKAKLEESNQKLAAMSSRISV